MRRIREALRLHLRADMSYSEVGLAHKISKSVVGEYVSLACVAGVDWDVAQTLDDKALQAPLYRAALPRSTHQLAPDFAVVHQECWRRRPTEPILTVVLLRRPLREPAELGRRPGFVRASA
jgi:hypothetical protein